jgi:hypothetical protein
MDIITDVGRINELLGLYKESKLYIDVYTSSLKRIALRLVPKDSDKIVYLFGVGCEEIKGKFRFQVDNLLIQSFVENADEKLTRLFDLNNGFDLIVSGGFILAIGSNSEFGSSFEDFLSGSSNEAV